MIRPCERHIDCPPDSPVTNYSSEDLDLNLFFGIAYGANGCVGRCTSSISQADADLCAQRQLVECQNDDHPPDQPPPVLFPNDPQECTVGCPDGSNTFTYFVPAGAFLAQSAEEANAQALSYACQQAGPNKFCLENSIASCACTGISLDVTIGLTGIDPLAATMSLESGALPPGLTLTGFRLSGAPFTPGNYVFSLRATDDFGNHADAVYTMAVLEIADDSLPNFQIGVAYSHQLTVDGGSGNYAFRIISGTLPTGLTMTLGGLISGTPTAGTSGILVFDVIDTNCAEADRSFFPPSVTLQTVSTTRIATVLGYPEFPGFVSTPPKKYHKLTWTGVSHQWADVLSTNENCGRAKYEWSGTGEIDGNGDQVSNYEKKFYAACPEKTQWPRFFANANIFLNIGGDPFKGYCWTPDPTSCPTCANPAAFSRNVAANSILDWSDFLRGTLVTMADSTNFQVHRAGPEPTTQWRGPWATGTAYLAGDTVSQDNFYYRALAVNTDEPPDETPSRWALLPAETFPGVLYPVVNFPTSEFNSVPHWVRMNASHWYEGLLEDEYTDAEALTHAYTFISGGNTAENTPRTTGFTSRFTAVEFTLVCANLIVGETYDVSVIIYNTKTGAVSSLNYSLVAASTVELITDFIPTPPAFQPLQVKSPRIAFA